MSNNRRDFLKISGLAGMGLVGAGISGFSQPQLDEVLHQSKRQRKQRFNMSGYAAPKIDVVRIGFVGLGSRGPGAVNRISKIENVEIKALCDLLPEQVDKVKKSLKDTPHQPDNYSGNTFAWKEMCDRDDIDVVFIASPWDWHVPMAVYAMEAGKHVAIEVPAATTLEECWQLVETSENTRKHCMMLENCCYDFFELMTLNMA